MIYSTDIEQIGKFLKTHALKGELNAQLEIDADFLRPEIPIIMDIDGIFVPFYPESVRPIPPRDRIRFGALGRG